jgi:solute carrier family 35 protein F5
MGTHIFKGCVCVLVLNILWILEGKFTQYLLIDGEPWSYNKPFFIKAASYSFVLALLPLSHFPSLIRDSAELLPIMRPSDSGEQLTSKHRTLLIFSIPFAIAYLTLGVTWYYSLPLTTLATNSILYQTYVIFSFVLSVYILNEGVTFAKGIVVLVTFMGIVAVALSPMPLPPGHIGAQLEATNGDAAVGIFLVLLSAFLYSLTQVLYSRYLENYISSTKDLFLFSGYQGFVALASIPLVLPILDYTGIESFELPPTAATVACIIVSGLTHLLYIPVFCFGISCTSPTFVSCGCTLTIPIAMVVDWISFNVVPSGMQAFGSCLVIAGVISYGRLYEEQTHLAID